MTPRPYSRLLNFAWYQLLWFTAVLGGVPLEPVLLVMLLLHLSLARHRASELCLMLGAAGLGMAFDGLLAAAGYFAFPQPPAVLPVPLWLLAIWMGFAGTLRYSMAPLVARPRLMAAAATVSAPLTYLAAQRLGAVTFPHGGLATAVVIGLSWWALVPALLWLNALTRGELLVSARAASFPIDRQEI